MVLQCLFLIEQVHQGFTFEQDPKINRLLFTFLVRLCWQLCSFQKLLLCFKLFFMAYKTIGLRGHNSLYFEFTSSYFQQFINGGGCPSPWHWCSCSSSCCALVGLRAVETTVPDQATNPANSGCTATPISTGFYKQVFKQQSSNSYLTMCPEAKQLSLATSISA